MTDAPTGRRLTIAGFVGSAGTQVLLTALGVAFFVTESAGASIVVLIVWCSLGTVYVGVVGAAIGRSARREQVGALRHAGIELSRPAQIIASTGTVLASLVGAGAALQLGFTRSDPVYGPATTLFGIWAMLLAWMLFQWGYAQLYFLHYYTSGRRTLEFPRTEHPRMVEFVYFAFTIATTFAASDVSVVTSGTRWRVVVHSIVSFFFNGLIIVFAFTTIANPS